MNPETLRCRILDYTKREMYQHGADGLTMDDIARGMKMSKRTLYSSFPAKRVCSVSVFLTFANGIRSRIQRKTDTDGQLVHGGTFSSQWMAISPCFIRWGRSC